MTGEHLTLVKREKLMVALKFAPWPALVASPVPAIGVMPTTYLLVPKRPGLGKRKVWLGLLVVSLRLRPFPERETS